MAREAGAIKHRGWVSQQKASARKSASKHLLLIVFVMVKRIAARLSYLNQHQGTSQISQYQQCSTEYER